MFLTGIGLLLLSYWSAFMVGEPGEARLAVALWFMSAMVVTGFGGVVCCIGSFVEASTDEN